MIILTKSQLFREYNHSRALARAGKLDLKSVNKALGVAQLKVPRPYHTTLTTCDCPCHLIRKVVCKHMIAKMFEAAVTVNTSLPKTITVQFSARTHDPRGVFGYTRYEWPELRSQIMLCRHGKFAAIKGETADFVYWLHENGYRAEQALVMSAWGINGFVYQVILKK